MSVSLEDIDRCAHLARIEVKEEEKPKFAEQLSGVVSYVDRLRDIDTSAVKDGAVFDDMLPPDQDIVRQNEAEHEQIIQNFPDRLGDLLRVPSVFPNRTK